MMHLQFHTFQKMLGIIYTRGLVKTNIVNSLISIKKKSDLSQKKYFFLIIEPGSKSGFLNSWIREYDLKTKLISERTFGSIRVQVRSNNLYK